MLREYVKDLVGRTLRGARKTRIGRFLHERWLAATFSDTSVVRHGTTELTLTVPNWIARYRAETFNTKEPETLEWLDHLPEQAIVWDVGANVGLYSLYAAKARACRVFAFEPSVFNLELLARNIHINGLQRQITLVPLPLSDDRGVNMFQMSTTSWAGALSTFAHGFDQDGVPFKTTFEYSIAGMGMDQARDHLGIPQPAFLKMDVDGIEHLILSGGPSVLSRLTSVLVEINGQFEAQAVGAHDALRRAGLTLYRKCDTGVTGVFNEWWRREP